MPTTTGQEKRRQLTGALLGTLIGVLVVGLIVLLVSTWQLTTALREGQKDSAERGKAIVRSTELIEDCTQPDGECFQEGQRRTAEAVIGINDNNRATIAAALACQADGITEERDFARCIARRASR